MINNPTSLLKLLPQHKVTINDASKRIRGSVDVSQLVVQCLGLKYPKETHTLTVIHPTIQRTLDIPFTLCQSQL